MSSLLFNMMKAVVTFRISDQEKMKYFEQIGDLYFSGNKVRQTKES